VNADEMVGGVVGFSGKAAQHGSGFQFIDVVFDLQ
jgi:hypothetical protein